MLGSQSARASSSSASAWPTRSRAIAMSRTRAPARWRAPARSIGSITWPGTNGEPPGSAVGLGTVGGVGAGAGGGGGGRNAPPGTGPPGLLDGAGPDGLEFVAGVTSRASRDAGARGGAAPTPSAAMTRRPTAGPIGQGRDFTTTFTGTTLRVRTERGRRRVSEGLLRPGSAGLLSYRPISAFTLIGSFAVGGQGGDRPEQSARPSDHSPVA